MTLDSMRSSLPGPGLSTACFTDFPGRANTTRSDTEREYCRLLAENAFVHHDLVHSIPLVDACADVVYTSHFLEHLFRPDAERVLKESFRVLKPGGLIRACVLDLAYAVSLYGAGQKRRMLTDFFFVEDLSSFHARHKYLYDFELLKEALVTAGFREVTRCAYWQGRAPDLDLRSTAIRRRRCSWRR